MRKLIVSNIVSLDGFFEGPGSDVMVLPMDPSFDAYNAERLRAADTLVVGRRTYENFKGFWPGIADHPEVMAERLGIPVERLATPVHRETSTLQNTLEKLVVSDSLTAEATAPWEATTSIVRRADARDRIAELKQRPGGELLVFGSRLLWNDLLTAGLVDELHLMVGAVALGGGTPAFGSPVLDGLRLAGVRTFDGSDNVLVQYRVERAA